MQRGTMNVKTLLICLLLAGCAAKKPVKTEAPMILRETWGAVEIKPGVFKIIAADAKSKEAALKELCKEAHSYICFEPQEIGKVYLLERKRK